MPDRYVRHETELEKLDRNFNEPLSELRVALPGVQVLFAFLLVAPFNTAFRQISEFERKLYLATLLATAVSSMLLIAPSMYHRILFRHHDKAVLIAWSNRLMIAGMTGLALAMTSAIMLVTHVLFGPTTAVTTAASVAAGFAGLWYAVPLRRRRRPPG